MPHLLPLSQIHGHQIVQEEMPGQQNIMESLFKYINHISCLPANICTECKSDERGTRNVEIKMNGLLMYFYSENLGFHINILQCPSFYRYLTSFVEKIQIKINFQGYNVMQYFEITLDHLITSGSEESHG